MHEKLKPYQDKAKGYFEQLQDVRVVGLLVFALMILLISWSGVRAIDTNYGLQKQMSELEQQNDVRELENKNLALQNKYLETPQYLELAARQNFGLALPGEKQVLVPKNVALAHIVDIPDQEREQSVQTKAKQPLYQQHFQAWINFFLHRGGQLEDEPR